MYLAMLEQVLFWGGLLVFLLSLVLYAGRTKDFKSLIEFWKPTIQMTAKEFSINRAGLLMMIGAVVLRLANFILN